MDMGVDGDCYGVVWVDVTSCDDVCTVGRLCRIRVYSS